MTNIIAKNIASSITDLGALIILLIAAKSHLIANEIFGSIMVAYFFGRGIIGGQKNAIQAMSNGSSNVTDSSNRSSGNITTSLFIMLAAGVLENLRKVKGL